MKNIKTTIVTAIGGVLITAGFVGAETVLAGGPENFPYFHLGTLILAGLIITGLKFKYDKMNTYEAVGAIGLYAILVSLFTNPVVMAIKNIMS